MTRMISTERKNNKVGCSPRRDNNQTPKEHDGAAVDSRDNKRSSKIESLKSGTALFTLWTRGNRRNKVRFTSFESSRRPLLPERQDISSRTWQTCTTDDENCTVESSSCNISSHIHEDEKESNRFPAECRAKATTATQRLQRSNASRFLLDSSLSTNMDTPSPTLLTHALSFDATLHSDTYQTNMEQGDEPRSCPPSSDLCQSHRPHKTDHDDILLVQLIHTDNDYEHHCNLHNEEAGSKQQHDMDDTTIADSVAPAFGALVLKRQPNQRDLFVLYEEERCDSFAVVHQPTIWKEEENDRQKQKKSIEFRLCRQMGKIHLNVPQPLVVKLSRYILLHLHHFWDYFILFFQALRNVHPPILLVLLTFVYTRNWNIIRYLSILLVVIHILAKVQTFLGMPLSSLRNMFQSRSLKKCRTYTKKRNGNSRPLLLLGKRKKGNFFFSKSNNNTPTHDYSKGTTTRPQMSEFKKQYALGVGAIAFPLVIEFICDYYTVATNTIHETRLAEIRHVLNAWNERGENASSSGGVKD